jgi:hypothetical protein
MIFGKRKERAVFLYRCHDYNEVIAESYENFMTNLELFRQDDPEDRSVELYIIGDNLHPQMKERLEQDHVDGKKYSFFSQLIEVNSRDQKERLVSGAACTPQHYTLYITSMNVVDGLGLKDRDVVFFIEDDYKFRREAFPLCFAFAGRHLRDFISPFDHPDRYSLKYREMENDARDLFLQGRKFRFHSRGLGRDDERTRQGYINYRLELIWETGHHWRTAISSCHTFLGTFQALRLSEPYLYHADVQRSDHVMWTHIWAEGRSRLWTPVPGLARHVGHKAKRKLLEDGDYEVEAS